MSEPREPTCVACGHGATDYCASCHHPLCTVCGKENDGVCPDCMDESWQMYYSGSIERKS